MLFSFQRPARSVERPPGPGEEKASRSERPTIEPRVAAIGSRRLPILEPSLLPVPLEATSKYSASYALPCAEKRRNSAADGRAERQYSRDPGAPHAARAPHQKGIAGRERRSVRQPQAAELATPDLKDGAVEALQGDVELIGSERLAVESHSSLAELPARL